MRFEGILFDNDGTLVDTHDMILASMRYSTREVLGRELPDEVLMRRVGEPLVVQFRDFAEDEGAQAELLRVYRDHNATIHDETIRAFPGAADALAQLKRQGCALGVVTSKLRSTAWRGLEIVGLSECFDCCIGAEDCVRFKPNAEPVERGCAALGLDPSRCLYVGDAPVDVRAGKAAGTSTAAVLWGMFGHGVLSAETPDCTCADFEELVAFCS